MELASFGRRPSSVGGRQGFSRWVRLASSCRLSAFSDRPEGNVETGQRRDAQGDGLGRLRAGWVRLDGSGRRSASQGTPIEERVGFILQEAFICRRQATLFLLGSFGRDDGSTGWPGGGSRRDAEAQRDSGSVGSFGFDIAFLRWCSGLARHVVLPSMSTTRSAVYGTGGERADRACGAIESRAVDSGAVEGPETKNGSARPDGGREGRSNRQDAEGAKENGREGKWNQPIFY